MVIFINMIERIKKFFALTNWKRWLISAITIISTFLAITFGSVFFVSKNVNKSIDYGGGIEVRVQIKDSKTNQNADKTLTEQVNTSLFNRLTGGTGLNGISVSTEGDGKIRITKSGEISDAERKEFESEIVEKPLLTITDINMKPLFYNGKFTEEGSLENGEPINWVPPFQQNGAKYTNQNGKESVQITLSDNDAVAEWTRATQYLSQQDKQLTGQNLVLMWLDIEKLINIAKTEFPVEWDNANHNLWNFIHVNEKPYEEYEIDGTKQYRANAIKENVIAVNELFLISSASVNSPINSKEVIINGNFTAAQAQKLANKINFGLSSYDLELLSSVYVNANLNNTAFDYAIIAGIVIFSVISLFMIVNYGLLGALSTISIALYIFLTLLMFTVLRGEYSPATIAALIIGIGISVDANVITFERLKKEVYSGDTLNKAFKNSNKMSISSIMDANITTIIVGFILFFLGTKDVRGFSITLILSILFTLLVMLVFTRFLATMLVGTGAFNDRLYLLGIRKRYIKHTSKLGILVNKADYLKNAKWFALLSLIFIIAGSIVFTIFAVQGQEFSAGINRSIEFSGGINFLVNADVAKGQEFTLDQANELKALLVKNASDLNLLNPENVISIQSADSNSLNYVLSIKTSQDLTNSADKIKNLINDYNSDLIVTNYLVSATEANKLVLNAFIATGISFIGIVIYILVRMNWTYSIAAIIGLLHDFLMVIAFVVITRLQVSTIIVAAVLSILGLSINDTVVTFDRIREKIQNKYANKILDKKDIKDIINSSIADTLKRSLFTSGTTLFAVATLLAFKNATNFTFNIVMLFGILIGVYSSIFICSWVWSKLELFRQRRIQKRIQTGYWNINKPEEQTFKGINDFKY